MPPVPTKEEQRAQDKAEYQQALRNVVEADKKLQGEVDAQGNKKPARIEDTAAATRELITSGGVIAQTQRELAAPPASVGQGIGQWGREGFDDLFKGGTDVERFQNEKMEKLDKIDADLKEGRITAAEANDQYRALAGEFRKGLSNELNADIKGDQNWGKVGDVAVDASKTAVAIGAATVNPYLGVAVYMALDEAEDAASYQMANDAAAYQNDVSMRPDAQPPSPLGPPAPGEEAKQKPPEKSDLQLASEILGIKLTRPSPTRTAMSLPTRTASCSSRPIWS